MFARLLEGLLRCPDIELYLLERPEGRRNIFRREVDVPEDRIIKMPERPLRLERYLPVSSLPSELMDGTPFIFHSSYYRYCSLPGAVNITTLHDFTYEVMRLRGAIPTFVHTQQKSRAIARSRAVACVSRSTLNDYLRLFSLAVEQKLQVIPNAPLCVPHEKCGRERNMNDLLFVGARAYHKNFRLVVEALSGTPWRLILCSSTLTPEELRLIETNLRPGQWEVCVFPDDRTLSAMYSRCRCLLYPSSYEGFGIPIVEAQMHGLPVITGNCPASVEVGGDATIVMPDYTPQSLRDAIKALDNKVLYKELQDKGLSNALRFSWPNIVEAYRNLYADALKG